MPYMPHMPRIPFIPHMPSSTKELEANGLYDFQWGDPFMLLIFAVG
jgi:hypothetical protein